jgi:hypothetical protein
LQEWKDLYDAAIRFKKLESWNWMWDSDVFGVQDPDSGEIGYCTILGSLKEVFALAVYMGTAGLQGYQKMQLGEVHPMDLLFVQNCLMASFEDREYLDKPDLKIIKDLGLKFRGRNAWPLFRRYEPGYAPWFITDHEARFLTLALEQAIEVSLRVRENEHLLEADKGDRRLVRISRKTAGGQVEWTDKWMKPKPLDEEKREVPPPDEVRLQKINKSASGRGGVWEVDSFFSPAAVREGKTKPFYPYMVLVADHATGIILSFDMTMPDEYGAFLPEQFLNAVERAGFIPEEVLVTKEEVMDLLDAVASNLKIEVRMVDVLEMIEEARGGMVEMLSRR